ncbi:MAG: hypothetical protein M3P15_01885 [Actinomycetota bacterium]|nr:hypothetical protein [Actinomycetota bacterium]
MDALSGVIERVYRARYVSFRNALATVTGDAESAHDVVWRDPALIVLVN